MKDIFIGLFALTVRHLLLDTWFDTLRYAGESNFLMTR